MKITQQLGQLFFIGLEGPQLLQKEADFIIENNIGGVTLFQRNLDNPLQIHQLCEDLQSLRQKMPGKHPLFIAIDMEGGRVHRLKEPFTQWPAISLLGEMDSTSTAFNFAQAMGSELRAMGINLNFAPSVDTLTNPKNELIGDRSISSDPEQVAKIASALVRGYIKSNVVPCVKHFPGHGNTIVDSHLDLPYEDISLEKLRQRELIPFKKTFRSRVDLVMTAHILFKKIDSDFPVTLSSKFLKDILRTELRYQRLVISDDLGMKALTKHFSHEEIPIRALQAGCNILLYCNDFKTPPIAIKAVSKAIEKNDIPKEHIEESYKTIIEVKNKFLENPEPLPLSEATKIVGCELHQDLAKAIREKREI